MKYAVIFEIGATSVGAYVPDLPGCVALGEDLKEARSLIYEAIPFHLEGMRRHGEEIPRPLSLCEYVEVRALAEYNGVKKSAILLSERPNRS